MEKWEIARNSGVCSVSGRPFEADEEHYVVLFEEGDTFRRADYALDAWSGPPAGAFCHFRSRVPPKKVRKRLFVDDDLLVNFFTRLADETDERRVRFRFVLGLILMRKRLLKYERTVHEQSRDIWRVRLVRDRSSHQVVDPRLTDDQIEEVSRQLGAILHGDAGEFEDDALSEPDAGDHDQGAEGG